MIKRMNELIFEVNTKCGYKLQNIFVINVDFT